MATKKAGSSTRLGRDSQPQYLGTKVANGEVVRAGQVLVRQRGTAIHPGAFVRRGKDDTLYSAKAGTVKFTHKKRLRFDGVLKRTAVANIVLPVAA